MVHVGKILVPAVALLVLAAPWILRVFGSSYAAAGTGALRLLGLSALPFVVSGTAVSAARGRRRTRQVTAVFGGLFVLIVPLGLVLLAVDGITGMALAVLIGQSTMAIILMAARRVWMCSPELPGDLPTPAASMVP